MFLMAMAILFGVTAPAMAQEYVYELTSTISTGDEILIVNRDSEGEGYALRRNDTSIAENAVNVKFNTSVADRVYIEDDNVQTTSKWIVKEDGNNRWTFSNGNGNVKYYIYMIGGSTLSIGIKNSNNKWSWDADNNLLSYYNTSNNLTYYLCYKKGFTTYWEQISIYLYKKVYKKVIFSATPLSLSFTCDPSQSVNQTISVSGSRLRDIVNVELTQNPNGVFSVSPTSFDKTSENTANGTVTVTFTPVEGIYNYTGTVTLSTTGADPIEVQLTGTVNSPEVTADKDELAFWQAPNYEHTQPFRLTAQNISDDVTIESSDGLFTVSADATNFDNSVTISAADAKEGMTVYVQFMPTEYGENFSGTISIKYNNNELDQITLSGRSYGQNVSVFEAGVTTYYYDKPLVIPYSSNSGLQNVLYVKSLESDEQGYTNVGEVKNPNIIPKETGVVIFANPDTYSFPVFNDYKNELESIGDNELKGTLTGTTTNAVIKDAKGNGLKDPIVLTLGRQPGGSVIGFYHYVGTSLAANKAYLIYDRTSSANNVNFFAIGGNGSEYTAIQDMETVKEQMEDGAWYTLQGVHLNDKPKQRGLYLYNGKKIMVK